MVELPAKRCPATSPTASASAARLPCPALAGELFWSISQRTVLRRVSIVQSGLSIFRKTSIYHNRAWTCAFCRDPNFRKSYCKTLSGALELLISSLPYIGQHVCARTNEANKVYTRTVCARQPAKSVQHRRAPIPSNRFQLEFRCYTIPYRST